MGKRSGGETTVSNAGSIALDLLRLCLYVPEEEGRARSRNNRYFLSIFDRHPSQYLAFTRQSASYPKREWLETLLASGDHSICIAFHEEPKSFRSICNSAGMKKGHPLFLDLRVATIGFEPMGQDVRDFFHGYLSRIIDFEIRTEDSRLAYRETPGDAWTEHDRKIQLALAEHFLGPA